MLRQVLTTAASGVDRMIASALLGRSKQSRARSRTESLGHDERMEALAQITALYDRPEHFSDPNTFFPAPRPISPRMTRVRRWSGKPDRGEVIDLTWPSTYEPFAADISDRYLEHVPNRMAAARFFMHSGPPRPAAILIHGYRCGQWAIEQRAWPIDWLLGRGLDVVLAVLPFHAVRARPGPPLFPSSDPRFTNDGFRQAASDLRALARFLRDRGSPAVGVMGMSLGGYTASLLLTIEDNLSFAAPIIPLASIADSALAGGRLVGTEQQQRLQHAAIDAVHRVVSPFARPSRLAGDRILVVAGSGDRITPMAQAGRLAAHFQAPLHAMHGGHLLQFGRSDAFREIGRMLGRLGLLSAKPQPERQPV
jgi:hypothetical protein